jgi:hypothetical protein
MLVRTIRPVLKEVDAFHQVLYMLYHYYLPNYDFEKIKASSKEMVVKMDELNKAQLPVRLKQNQQKFDKARLELEMAVKKLNDVIVMGDNKNSVENAVDKLHAKYEDLENVFN